MLSKSNFIAMAYTFIIAVMIGVFVLGGYKGMNLPTELIGDFDLYTAAVVIVLGLLALVLGADKLAIAIIGSLATLVALTVHQDALTQYTTLSALLFSIGVYGMTTSRNAVRVLMSIELMLNAVNINLVAFARYVDSVQLRGQVFSVFVLTVAAAEAAVGLAIVLAIYRNAQTVDMEKFKLLKW